MTKLEEKLIELEYEFSCYNEEGIEFYKGCGNPIIIILIDYLKIHLLDAAIEWNFNKTKIDEQQAFNEMQKDLGILKEYLDDK